MSIKWNILFVDDEPRVLEGFRRQLRGSYELAFAESGDEALQRIDQSGPFAAIVSDMRMPGMNGIELLRKARERSPDSVRIMLTGNADQSTAMDAVNRGQIFRFLTKPCPAQSLEMAIGAAVDQYKLITAERELVERTLAGSVKTLVEILSLAAPAAFSRALLLRDWSRRLGKRLEVNDLWKLDVAATLSQIGWITVPAPTLRKVLGQEKLSEAEADIVRSVPETGARMVRNIPRLDGVADIIAFQDKGYDGSGPPGESVSGDNIPIGARILKVLSDGLRAGDGSLAPGTFDTLASRGRIYDPRILAAARELVAGTAEPAKAERTVVNTSLGMLIPGDLLLDDIAFDSGELALCKGSQLSEITIARLVNHGKLQHYDKTIRVLRG